MGTARPEWIEIAVPALVRDATFALAQEQLEKNKRHSPRRTVAPSLPQGMLVCQQCGYALYRSSARTSKQKLYYYRCIGSDAYRQLCGPVCTNRPIRQDYLDQFVWQEIIRVLEEPELIQAKIQRPSAERLPPAYQENLLTLAELRRRMPELRKHQQAMAAGWGTRPPPQPPDLRCEHEHAQLQRSVDPPCPPASPSLPVAR